MKPYLRQCSCPEKMATLRQQEQKPFRVSSACCTVLVFNALHTSLPLDTEAHYQFSAGAEGPMWNGGEALSSLSRVSKYDLVFQRHLDGWRGECLESAEGGRRVSGIVNSHMSISACFWAWWKTQPNPTQNETVAPAYLAHKYLGGQSQYVNVPKEVMQDLIHRSKGVVLSDTGELTACGNAFVLPRLKLHDMLEVIDTPYRRGIPPC